MGKNKNKKKGQQQQQQQQQNPKGQQKPQQQQNPKGQQKPQQQQKKEGGSQQPKQQQKKGTQPQQQKQKQQGGGDAGKQQQQKLKKEDKVAALTQKVEPPQKKARVEQQQQKGEKKKEKEVKQVAALAPPDEHDQDNDAGLEDLDEGLKQELFSLQEEFAKIAEEELAEVAKITRKFNGKRKPTLEKRKNTIAKIPGFWLQALAYTPAANLISDKDAEILQHLKDIVAIEPTDDESDKNMNDNDFKIVMTFDKNPFFQNKQLWKEVKYTGDDEEPTVTNSPINWNKGKNPLEKKNKNEEGAKQQTGKRSIDDVDDDDSSFFEWFANADGDGVELGEWFRDQFLPNAIKYFFGDVDDDDDDLDSDDEAALAGYYSDDDDDDDDNDDDANEEDGGEDNGDDDDEEDH